MRNFFKFLVTCMLVGITTFGNISQTEANPIPEEFSNKIILAEKLDYENKVPIINTGVFFMNTTYNIIKHSGYIQKDWMYGALAVDIYKGKKFKVNEKPLVIYSTKDGNMSVTIKNEYKNKKSTKFVESEIIFSSLTKNENRETVFSVNGQTKIKENKAEKKNYNWRTAEMVKNYRQMAYKYYEDKHIMSFIVLSPFCLLTKDEE